eukprot:TRINITY_DN7601_c0_g2_i4.p1 TRINITY_DN7601_c0_g2~~TRINITY_DN7601_c0_g2_i4.p1  ORF type:complete len:105 (-),score=27.38 TRINITY_DN7601_c0_g2_i4:74-388(-)
MPTVYKYNSHKYTCFKYFHSFHILALFPLSLSLALLWYIAIHPPPPRNIDVILWNNNNMGLVGYVAVCVCVCVYCLLYTSDAADEEDSVDLGGRRIIKKKKKKK